MKQEKFKLSAASPLRNIGLSESQINEIEKEIGEIKVKDLNIKFLDKKREYTNKELLEKKKRFIEKHGKNGKFFLGDGEGNG
jgi:hypothetical protein